MIFRKGYRTIIFNGLILLPAIATTIIEVAATLLDDPSIRAIVPDAYAPALFASVAVANIVLRMKTTTPVFKDADGA